MKMCETTLSDLFWSTVELSILVNCLKAECYILAGAVQPRFMIYFNGEEGRNPSPHCDSAFAINAILIRKCWQICTDATECVFAPQIELLLAGGLSRSIRHTSSASRRRTIITLAKKIPAFFQPLRACKWGLSIVFSSFTLIRCTQEAYETIFFHCILIKFQI